jgi:acyl-ACP thioesterase
VSERPATELLPLPAGGRRFAAERTVRLGDVDPAGELRLDAVARYLQDVASDDALDAALPNALGWMVRRTMIRVDAPGVLGERVRLTTFCTGHGRSWAERRTTVAAAGGAGGAAIEAVSLWVQIDPDTGRPARLGEAFFDTYGEAAAGRVVSSKLGLPTPPRPGDAESDRPWRFRRTDLDPFDHVNNAAAWALVEERLQERRTARQGLGEVEYLGPADAGVEFTAITDGEHGWLIDDARTLIAWRWAPRRPS